MLKRSPLIAVIALFALAIAACGVDPSGNNPPSEKPVTVTCLTTEAYALEHIVAVIGQDPVPTAFDAINSGSCETSERIVKLHLSLVGDSDTQDVVIELPSPSTTFAIPLADAAGVPTIQAPLQTGRYERHVVGVTADGRQVVIPGFEPVILVAGRTTMQANLFRAQSRWDRAGVSAYTYTFETMCFCPEEIRTATDVQVLDAEIIDLSFVDPKFVDEVPFQERFKTIDELLALVQDAIDRSAASIRAEFHPELGYPVDVFIDYEAMMADEEFGFLVGDLRY
jgi:hypothetical protein